MRPKFTGPNSTAYSEVSPISNGQLSEKKSSATSPALPCPARSDVPGIEAARSARHAKAPRRRFRLRISGRCGDLPADLAQRAVPAGGEQLPELLAGPETGVTVSAEGVRIMRNLLESSYKRPHLQEQRGVGGPTLILQQLPIAGGDGAFQSEQPI